MMISGGPKVVNDKLVITCCTGRLNNLNNFLAYASINKTMIGSLDVFLQKEYGLVEKIGSLRKRSLWRKMKGIRT
jgi:hypothetical protein